MVAVWHSARRLEFLFCEIAERENEILDPHNLFSYSHDKKGVRSWREIVERDFFAYLLILKTSISRVHFGYSLI